eukprot:scaffold48772_cov23-Tisochrysis_lutea.AAC.1
MMYVAKARLPKLCNCSTPHSLLPRAARACSSSLCRQQSAYIVVWAVATEVFAVYVTLNMNGECKPWSTASCFSGWPHHELVMPQRWWVVPGLLLLGPR